MEQQLCIENRGFLKIIFLIKKGSGLEYSL